MQRCRRPSLERCRPQARTTHAVIEALTGAVGDSVSFPEIAGEIIRLARVEAERISVTQTPVFLGNVQGGLVFPTLKRGDNYAAAFPARAVQQMSGSFAEFSAHGFPPEIVNQWTTDFPRGLSALQLKAVNEHGVLAGRSLLVVAPTSSGKTMIGKVAAIQVGPVLGGRYDLGFFTYETLLNLALGSPHLLNQLGSSSRTRIEASGSSGPARSPPLLKARPAPVISTACRLSLASISSSAASSSCNILTLTAL